MVYVNELTTLLYPVYKCNVKFTYLQILYFTQPNSISFLSNFQVPNFEKIYYEHHLEKNGSILINPSQAVSSLSYRDSERPIL